MRGCNDTKKKSGIGLELSAWHTFHTKAGLQLLDAVLGDFSTLAVPDQRIFCRLLAIAYNHVILGLIIKQFSLAFVLDYDQVERLMRVIQRMSEDAC